MNGRGVARNLAVALAVTSAVCGVSGHGAADSSGSKSMKPADYLSGASISVRSEQGSWVIAGRRVTVTVDGKSLAVRVASGVTKWHMLPASADDLALSAGGEGFAACLTDATKIEITPYDTGARTGIKVDLTDFRRKEEPLDLRLQLFLCLENGSEDLVCEAVAVEQGCVVKELLWPKAFEPASVDATVIPAMQGMLLPRDWPKKAWLYDNVVYGRGLYMPWWGYQKGGSAAVLILETPADGACHMEHPAGGPTRMQLRWLHSLGRLSYPRRVRISFIESGNYVDMARRYRDYVIDTGHFVSLKEKIARRPVVGKLIGSPVVHLTTAAYIEPASIYYNKDNPAANKQLTTFDTRAAELQTLQGKGVSRAYVHLDGWGFRGYDNQLPDVLPPNPEAGGWDGLKRFADTCDKLGYVFAIHDQYRDYYLNASSYNDRHAIREENGNIPRLSIWYGGEQSILCPRLAPDYVSRNHRSLLEHGVKVRGAYLDVFGVVPPDECYNPEHPVSRAECLKYRGDCLDLVRSLLGVVSSEEPADWAIPYLDLVHHGPYSLDPNPGAGPAMGIPVPLFSLVYHDALILPWTSTPTKGGWGIPDTDSGYLHCLLNAGIPYVSLAPDEAEMTRLRTMCALHRRVGLRQMVRHEFLDQSRRRQRTTFADGTRVTVDFDSGSFEVRPSLTQAELDAVFGG